MADFTIRFDYDKAKAHPLTYNKAKKQWSSYGYDMRPDTPLIGIVLHSTEGEVGSTFQHECEYVRDTKLVSAHYYIGKDGTIQRILDPGPYRAWHAGESFWDGQSDLNDNYIGIEMHHAGNEVYTVSQLDALRWLVLELLADHDTITTANIACHRWVATPAGRKSDPVGLSDDFWHDWIDDLAPEYPFKSAPTITSEVFDSVLASYNSPARQERPTRQYYDYCVDYGINPAVALAFFIHESKAGTWGIAKQTLNWGNVRVPENKALSNGTLGGFATYPDWLHSLEDWCQRIVGLKYLGRNPKLTIREALLKYAPYSDNNDPDAYADDVQAKVAEWAAESRLKAA